MSTLTVRCAHCGELYETLSAKSRFCTSAHRAANWRARQAEAHDAEAELRRIGNELLARLTHAVIDGASESELDEIIAEAHRVLPER